MRSPNQLQSDPSPLTGGVDRSRASKTILVVDDERAFLDSVARMLRLEGDVDYTLVAESSQVPALLEEKTFDVALLDITMPGLGGMELLEIIKARSPRTECIMITAHDSVPLVIAAIKQGAYNYLIKPIGPAQLAHAMERALEHQVLLDASAQQEELERKVRAAEQAKKDLELVLSEKMGALGQLVAGVTHEVNTPLGAICSTSKTLGLALARLNEALDRNYPGARKNNHDISKALETIAQASSVITSGGDRVAKIVARLGTFARLDEADFKPIDIHQGIDDVLALLAHQITETVQITKDYGELPQIPCYPRQLNQVFMNLLLNARQAIDGQGTIGIRTSRVGDQVQIVFRDSGRGIPADKLNQIFDPGYTTRGVGVGAGLGLSICYRIVVDKHNGELRVDSEEGKGTCVTVVLPTRLSNPGTGGGGRRPS